MADLRYRQEKIQAKRKQTSFRDFVKEIGSWFSVNFCKNDGLISKYPKQNRFVSIVSFKDEDSYINQMEHEVQFEGNFFQLMKGLTSKINFANLTHFTTTENCDYVDLAAYAKDAYLSWIVTVGSEYVSYSISTKNNCSHVFDSLVVWNGSKHIYRSSFVLNSYKVFFSSAIQNSNNIRNSINMIGCTDCINCSDLVNQSYCINNKQFTKQEYYRHKEKILNDHRLIQNNSTNLVIESENINNGLFVYRIRNGNNLVMVGGEETCENMYDTIGCQMANDIYGAALGGGGGGYNYCTFSTVLSSNMYYCMLCESCSYCLGCIGLKNKQFCIFNKQYTKEEWHKKVDEIFTQMDQDGTLGEFFPGSMCPFYFNDTVAYLIDDTFTKEEVEKDGYLRRDEEIKVDIPNNIDVVDVKDLDIVNYDESILKKVIRDEKGNYYRIVKMEYDFLKKHNLPLPTLHWMDRLKQHFSFG